MMPPSEPTTNEPYFTPSERNKSNIANQQFRYNYIMKRFWQIGNIVSLGFALTANGLVGGQFLDLPSIGQISDKYATLLTPAGYAFSIWSLIYILLVGLVIYQARDIFRPRTENELPQRMGPYFIIASICNGLWTYVFAREWVGLSVIILLLLTASLYALIVRLRIALDNPHPAIIVGVWWPLMIYTGWVTVASVVNIASWLDSINLTVSPLWAIIILIGLGIGLLVLLLKRNVRELLLACVWGIAAIGVGRLESNDSQLVANTAFVVAGVLLISTIIHAYANRHSNILAKFAGRQTAER